MGQSGEPSKTCPWMQLHKAEMRVQLISGGWGTLRAPSHRDHIVGLKKEEKFGVGHAKWGTHAGKTRDGLGR